MSTQTTTETFAEIGIPTNPFPGLRPFEFDESHLFFGRDGQSEQLIGKLSRTHFLAVVGTSGSGKSSLVRAGFLPALYGGFMSKAGSGWRVAIMRPGNDPIGNLARALNAPDVFGSDIDESVAIQTAMAEATLRRGSLGLVDAVSQAVMPGDENLLVVVDQFEEIFRFARVAEGEQYGNEAAGFVKLLLEASGQREIPIYVVLTMRSDYLGDCSQFWELPEAINESQYLIPRLTRDQLREAITGPVAVGGGQITPRLVNRLLNDVGDNQDQLPVLQHLLMRVWDELKEKRLTVEVKSGDQTINRPHQQIHQGDAMDLCCAEAVGGMTQALSRHADEAFNELPDERHRVVAEKLFKALTEKGTDNREIRRPIILGEICAVTGATAAEAISVIETFRQLGRSFLMPPAGIGLNSESLIDISHESLIRGWARLKNWVEEEARSARTYQRLADTAELYRKGEEGFLRDPGLQLALDWHEQNRPNQAWARRYHAEFDPAMDFLRESKKKQDEEVAERERQQQAEIERTKRELEQAQALAEAEKMRAEAETQKAQEQQQRLAEKAKSATRLRRLIVALLVAGLLALTAMTVAAFVIRTASVRRQEAIKAQERAATAEASARSHSESAEESKRLAKEKTDEANKLAWSAKEEKQRAEALQQKADSATRAAEVAHKLALEQQVIAQEKEKSNQALIYVANMKLAQQAYGENDFSRVKELLDPYSPGQTQSAQQGLRSFEWYHLLYLHHKDPETLEHTSEVSAVAFSPDGKTLAAASVHTVTLWDTGRPSKPQSLEVDRNLNHALAFSSDGILATLSDATVELWDAKGVKRAEFQVPRSNSPSLAFSPNGKLLAVAGGETVRLWDMANKNELKPLPSPCNSVAFSPDGETLAVRGGETVKLWNVRTWEEKPVTPLQAKFTTESAMAFSPDSKMLAVASAQEVKLWDPSTLEQTVLKGHQNLVLSLAFSPDGRTLATGSADRTAKLWSIATGKEVPTAMRHSNYVFSVAFSPDGKTLATGSFDHTVRLWDLSWLQDQLPLTQYSWAVLESVAFSADGRLLASTATDNTVDLWDTGTRRRVATISGHQKQVSSVTFSPNGDWLATGSEDGTVKIWRMLSNEMEKPLFTISNGRPVKFIAFSPDGKTLAIGSENEKLKLWDVESKTFSPALKGDCDAKSVAFLPVIDSREMLAVGCSQGVKLWDLKTRGELPGPSPTSSGSPAAFSPDRKRLAIIEGNDVKLWDLDTQKQLVLKGHSGSVVAVAFSPDGKTLASGGYDSTVKLWNLRTGQEVATLKRDWAGDFSIITSIAFSRDGSMLAVGSMDGSLRLWYAPTNENASPTSDRASPK